MTLHIFNPEHDIALAADKANFTAPHAGRQLRRDLGFLPALWAEASDEVLVDNVDVAERAYAQLMRTVARLTGHRGVRHARWTERAGDATAHVEPWGWDKALRAQLAGRTHRLGSELLPTDEQLADIRSLSHRATSAAILPHLRFEGTVGEADVCTTVAEVASRLRRHGRVVLKAPWSSSGRGVRFVDAERSALLQEGSTENGWLCHLLERQGAVMVEPYYNKVMDFGMEFHCRADGHVDYAGLSLFHTVNGAYTGNILATETRKALELGQYLPVSLIEQVQTGLCEELARTFGGRYVGPLGVDMMVVKRPEADGFSLHPCVEINVRRTMGHVALALTPLVNPSADDDLQRVMRIDYQEGNYKLTLQRI